MKFRLLNILLVVSSVHPLGVFVPLIALIRLKNSLRLIRLTISTLFVFCPSIILCHLLNLNDMWFLCCSNRIKEEVDKKEPSYNAGLVCLGIFDSFSDLTNQVNIEFVNYPVNSLIVFQSECWFNLNAIHYYTEDGEDLADLPM